MKICADSFLTLDVILGRRPGIQCIFGQISKLRIRKLNWIPALRARMTAVGLMLVSVLLLTACGFTPVYAPQTGTDVPQALSQIQIDIIANRSGQILRNELIDRLYPRGHQGKIRYNLSVNLTESTVGLSIARDATLTRSQSLMTAGVVLTDLATRKPVLKRTLSGTSTYNVLPSQFGTLITEQDAKERALRALADQITTVLQLHFKNRP